MKKRLVGFCLCLTLVAVFVFASERTQPDQSSRTPIVTVLFGSGSIPEDLRPKVGKWLVSHFQYLLGPHWVMQTAGTSVVAAGYKEGAAVYVPQVYSWVHDV